MAEKGKHFAWQGSTLTYAVGDQGQVSIDVSKLDGAIVEKIVQFGLPTLLRNATAGLLTEDPAAAFERVKARADNFLAGVWRTVSAASAEPRTSLLAKAVAASGAIAGVTDEKAAADWIGSVIEQAIKQAGLDPESETDEEACRRTGAALRKKISETKEVAPILADLRAKAAAERAQAAKAKVADAPSLASI